MTRTNIDIDDELVETVMKQNNLPSKKAAVDFALRKVVREPLTKEFLLSLEGIGWGSDGLELEDIRNDTHKYL